MKPKDEDDFGDSDEEPEKEAHKNIATKKSNKCAIF